MNDSLTMLESLRRPGLLIRTARIGAATYKRERDLGRLIKASRLPGSREAILRLLEEEDQLNEIRQSGHGHYSVMRHVDVMIALLGEALIIKASQESDTVVPIRP